LLFVTLLSAQSKGGLFLRSILIPGWGQIASGRNYGYAMLASEVTLISSLLYLDAEEDLKRDEAYHYALKFAHIEPGSHSEDYFRDLSKYNSSGFEAGGYNDMVRRDAIRLYPNQPDLQQQYIDANIYGEDLSWNWDNPANRTEYVSYRKKANELKDYAKVATGVLVFNHLISGIDVFRFSRKRVKAQAYMSVQDGSPILNLEIPF